jgi:hypothetical protein
MARFARRTFLARRVGLSSVERIYRTRDAIEVDELEGYDVTRRRVLFDEVLLVTLHKEVGWPFVVLLLVLLTFAGFFTLIAAAISAKAAVASTVLVILPLIALLVLRLALRVDIITVQSRRTRARIPFWFNKERAGEVFRLVTRLAREAQAKVTRARAAAPVPGVAPPSPPPAPPPGSAS